MDKQEKSKFVQWLELLQQESWQLELIISGFSIFLLVGVYEPMQDLWRQTTILASNSNSMNLLILPMTILQGSWLVLLTNLIIHVLLRGLWISTVGLRYVSEDIDFDTLNFHPRFDHFLRKHIVSFDRYIERLEKICSIIFAFSFLLIFILISLGVWLMFFGSIDFILNWLPLGQRLTDTLDTILSIFILLTSLLYFIDFLSFGWIKRRKRLALFYYPFYRFYSWITLSFLYRPMYYNLADNRFGRWVGFLLVPYIILIMVASSVSFVTETYFPTQPKNLALSTDVYDDLQDDKLRFVRATIPSKYVSNDFLELFLAYNPRLDDKAIESICPGLTPARQTGVRMDGVVRFDGTSTQQRKVDNDSLLQCMNQLHQVYINDSLYSDLKYRFYTHPERDKMGLLTILDIDYLSRGEHMLKVKTYSKRGEEMKWRESANIPFWKE